MSKKLRQVLRQSFGVFRGGTEMIDRAEGRNLHLFIEGAAAAAAAAAAVLLAESDSNRFLLTGLRFLFI